LADQDKDVEQGGGVVNDVIGAGVGVAHRVAASGAKIGPLVAGKEVPTEDEETFPDGASAMRKLLMEMQGLKSGNLNSKEKA